MRTIFKIFKVPIYDVKVAVVCSDDIKKLVAAQKKLFSDEPDDDFGGMCCYEGSQFGLFFKAKYICLDVVAHEVFHLTHRILEFVGGNFDAEHHEQAAYLHGYLMCEVHRVLGIKFKV